MFTKNTLIFLFILILFPFYSLIAQVNNTMSERLKGKILLQVEENGEAWYVHPATMERMFLGRPKDAFDVMRGQGVGITNNDLNKIPIGISNNTVDSDNDGISDYLEITLGLNPNNPDSDSDGYSDKDELLNGYSPWGVGRQSIDNNFTEKQKGKILLQVEKNGEAWYVNPDDRKRYYLGRPKDAFAVMKRLGLGIKTQDLTKIARAFQDEDKAEVEEVKNNTSRYINDDGSRKSINGDIGKGYNIEQDDYYLHDPRNSYDLSIETTCLTKKEHELATIINDYRESLSLSRIPISKSLTYLEKVHALDQIQNPVREKSNCSVHSWSEAGHWTGCCAIVGVPSTYWCLGDKFEEFLDYPVDAMFGENGVGFKGLHAFGHKVSPISTLLGWQNSHGHHMPMINGEIWSNYTWRALGVTLFNGIGYMIPAEAVDEYGEPPLCSENDYEMCDKMKNKNLQNECYYEEILSNTGYYECDNEPTQLDQMNCRNREEYNSDVCEQIAFFPVQQQICYRKAALHENDVSLCELAGDENKRRDCTRSLAVKTDDVKMCEKLTTQSGVDECISSDEVEITDPEVCNIIVSSIYKNKCFGKVAKTNKDPEICELIESDDDATKDFCIRHSCELFPPSERNELDICDLNSDEKNEEIDKCFMIQPGKARDFCLKGLSDRFKDHNICDKIENLETEEDCYYEFAKNYRDIDVCGLVDDENRKSQCIEYVSSSSPRY